MVYFALFINYYSLHLALIHVSRALIVVQKGDVRRNEVQDVAGVELLVFCVVSDVFFHNRDAQLKLLLRADPLNAIVLKISHRPDESGLVCVDENSGVLNLPEY